MCLYKVDQRLAGRGTKIYTGWKIFEKHDSQYCFRYYLHEEKSTVPVNQWLKSTERSIGSGMGARGDKYDSGFHIYRDSYIPQYEAKIQNRLVAVEVKYRKVVARGRETDDVVIVAREMYVPYRKPECIQNVNKAKK